MEEKVKKAFKIFGKNIKNLRNERNMTIQELSELIGIRTQYLKRIELGTAKRLNASHIFIFAKAFKIKSHEVVKNI